MLVRALLAGLAAVALLVPLAGPAPAHPLAHGDAPRILNPRPAPGAVVPAGENLVAALVASDAPVDRARLTVDGTEVALDAPPGDHPTLATSVTLSAGWHTVELEVGNAAGQDQRAWRVRASGVAVTRLAGSERVETAAAISRDRFPQDGGAEAAVLARADDYPDALAGAPFAFAQSAPLLLTARDRLSAPAASELDRALPAGATVYLLGGAEALSDAVRQEVEARGFRVERLAGSSRYGTSAQVSRGLADPRAAVVASGEGFADALSASGAAALEGYPVLLTSRGGLPEPTRAYLEQAGPEEVFVVGGSAVVSEGVVAELERIVGPGRVTRVAGSDRFATSRAVAQQFFTSPESVAVASGRQFPDALAGGPHAAGRNAPMLLSAATTLPDPQTVYVQATQPDAAVIYGGAHALADTVAHDLRRAVASADGPVVAEFEPREPRVQDLDEVVIGFDRELDVDASSVHVRIDGHEVPGTLATGDFSNTLVFSVDDIPDVIQPGVTYEVRVVVAATDGPTWRHLERRLELHRPRLTLSRGDEGDAVARLQQRLEANRFWVGPIDGVYGSLTRQAVMAVQKTHGLEPDGVYGPATRQVLESDPPPPESRSRSGLVYEVDLARRVLMLVADGEVAWVFNTAAGHGRVYEFEGSTYRATTTTGRHTVTRQIDGLREAARGKLWRPKYYDTSRGIAIHGSTSVPAHHASAGCIRVTYAAMDFLWSVDPGTGAGVWVYPDNYYN